MGEFKPAAKLVKGDLFVISSGRDADARKLRYCVSVRQFRSGGNFTTVAYLNAEDCTSGETSLLDGSDSVEVLSMIEDPAELEEMCDLLPEGQRIVLWSYGGGIWA